METPRLPTAGLRGAVHAPLTIRPENAAQTLAAFNPRHQRLAGLALDQPIPKPLMIAFEVVMLGELFNRPPQVPLTDGDDLREALFLDRPHEPLGVGVQVRTPWRHPHALDARRGEQRSERAVEEWIAVVNQVTVPEQEAIEPVNQRSSAARDPFTCWLFGDARDANTPSREVDDEEDMKSREAAERPGLDGEEVRRRDRLPVRPQEGPPRYVPLRCRLKPMLDEDPPDRRTPDAVAEIGERPLNPQVPPSRILRRHAQAQLADRPHHTARPTPPLRTAVVLASDQLTVPAQDRVRRDNRAELGEQLPTKHDAFRGESATLTVVKPEPPAAELLPEHAVLLPKILNGVLLPVVEPAGKKDD